MTNVLTAAQGANFVRTESNDAVMLMLLPLVDNYLYNATGHDWTADSPINPTAISAAGMILVNWYDNPAQVGQPVPGVPMAQLEAEALKYRKYDFAGASGAGTIYLEGTRKGDEVIKLVGTYNVDGDQSDDFEPYITNDNQIEQITDEDLSENLYVVVLKHPADDVRA